MSEPIKILVVCTGNLCRSPLVEGLLDRELRAAGVAAEVASAGLAAPVGATPDRKMLRAAEDVGIDLGEHRSRQLDVAQLEAVDATVAMTTDHIRGLMRRAPHLSDQFLLLRAAAWKADVVRHRQFSRREWIAALSQRDTTLLGQDLQDPLGGTLRRYRSTVRDAEIIVRNWVAAWPRR